MYILARILFYLCVLLSTSIQFTALKCSDIWAQPAKMTKMPLPSPSLFSFSTGAPSRHPGNCSPASLHSADSPRCAEIQADVAPAYRTVAPSSRADPRGAALASPAAMRRGPGAGGGASPARLAIALCCVALPLAADRAALVAFQTAVGPRLT